MVAGRAREWRAHSPQGDRGDRGTGGRPRSPRRSGRHPRSRNRRLGRRSSGARCVARSGVLPLRYFIWDPCIRATSSRSPRLRRNERARRRPGMGVPPLTEVAASGSRIQLRVTGEVATDVEIGLTNDSVAGHPEAPHRAAAGAERPAGRSRHQRAIERGAPSCASTAGETAASAPRQRGAAPDAPGPSQRAAPERRTLRQRHRELDQAVRGCRTERPSAGLERDRWLLMRRGAHSENPAVPNPKLRRCCVLFDPDPLSPPERQSGRAGARHAGRRAQQRGNRRHWRLQVLGRLRYDRAPPSRRARGAVSSRYARYEQRNGTGIPGCDRPRGCARVCAAHVRGSLAQFPAARSLRGDDWATLKAEEALGMADGYAAFAWKLSRWRRSRGTPGVARHREPAPGAVAAAPRPWRPHYDASGLRRRHLGLERRMPGVTANARACRRTATRPGGTIHSSGKPISGRAVVQPNTGSLHAACADRGAAPAAGGCRWGRNGTGQRRPHAGGARPRNGPRGTRDDGAAIRSPFRPGSRAHRWRGRGLGARDRRSRLHMARHCLAAGEYRPDNVRGQRLLAPNWRMSRGRPVVRTASSGGSRRERRACIRDGDAARHAGGPPGVRTDRAEFLRRGTVSRCNPTVTWRRSSVTSTRRPITRWR